MAAALELFAVHGVSGTSLQMIANVLGVTKSAIYHQFKTKDELVVAVAEAELVRLAEALDIAEAEPDRTRALDVLLTSMVDLAVQHRRVWFMLQTDPEMLRFLGEQEPFRKLLERQYRVLLGDDAGVETRVPVALLTAAIMGGVIHPLVADVDNDTLRDHLRGLVRMIVDTTC
jgi:AcrR family transcriptional regulator